MLRRYAPEIIFVSVGVLALYLTFGVTTAAIGLVSFLGGLRIGKHQCPVCDLHG